MRVQNNNWLNELVVKIEIRHGKLAVGKKLMLHYLVKLGPSYLLQLLLHTMHQTSLEKKRPHTMKKTKKQGYFNIKISYFFTCK